MIDLLWAKAFALTLVVEVPLVAACAPRGARPRAVLLAAATQALTHPLAWLVFQQQLLGFWGVEITVVVVEACVYALATRRVVFACMASLLANAASAGLGVLWLGA